MSDRAERDNQSGINLLEGAETHLRMFGRFEQSAARSGAGHKSASHWR